MAAIHQPHDRLFRSVFSDASEAAALLQAALPADRRELRPIVPVVFYQGARGWNHSTEFADLFPEAARAWPWVPRLTHELLGQTTLEPQAVAGSLRSRRKDGEDTGGWS